MYAPEDWTMADLKFAAERGDEAAAAEYRRRVAEGNAEYDAWRRRYAKRVAEQRGDRDDDHCGQ
jgi:hypothetical protein